MTTTRVMLGLVLASAGVTWIAARHDGAAIAADVAPASREAADELACAPDGRGFRELVELVRARATDLDRRERALRARERDLAAVREAASAEIARLETIAERLGITGASGSGVSIAKIYESMDPADVVPILDRLDDVTLRVVLGRMREKQVGAILASMHPARAVAVTKAFAAAPVAAR